MYLQKPGPKPGALAFKNYRPGQKPPQAKHRAWLGPAFFGLAWPGFWPQAGAGTSLVTIALLSAVSITTSRVTSPRHADLYLQHMQVYLTGLKELFLLRLSSFISFVIFHLIFDY